MPITGSNSGNLIVRLPGKLDQPPLFMAAHMDVVAEMENPKIIFEDGIFRTDGTTILGADDKAGIIALLETATVLVEEKLEHGPVEFVFTVCEEIGLVGAKALKPELLEGRWALFSTAATFRQHNYPSTLEGNFHCLVRGKAAHAGVLKQSQCVHCLLCYAAASR